MRFGDLMATCLHNLFRHKSRTILTVLGVVVGCCSVVLMISFGIAMKLSVKAMLAEMGDLTVIEVNGNGGTKLEESSIDTFRKIQGVAGVAGKISANDVEITMQTADGRYKCSYASVTGVDIDGIEGIGYVIDKGDTLTKADSKNGMLFGQRFAYDFCDTMRPAGHNMVDYWSMYQPDGTVTEPPDPYFDPVNAKMQIVLGSTDETASDKKVVADITVKGVLQEDYNKGGETSWGALISADLLKSLITQYKRENGMNISNKITYDTIIVKANDISVVPEVENQIKSLGYSTYSMESVRKPIEKDANQKQLMFAGLGIVSLFVAALGIMNTMIMSITERTREIGVMKALGCFVGNIRVLFLMEAGFIGFIGGVIGSVLSLIGSCVLNIVMTETEIVDFETLKQVLLTNTDRISVIPWQLVIGAIAFSVFVGVISGFYPANKAATKISALEAIRSE